jgi:hypothetical protein
VIIGGAAAGISRGLASGLEDRIHRWLTRDDIEFRFGDGSDSDLALWRGVLARITDGGRLDGFSSAFTRDTGLEIT